MAGRPTWRQLIQFEWKLSVDGFRSPEAYSSVRVPQANPVGNLPGGRGQ
jgi:hypothetical protein